MALPAHADVTGPVHGIDGDTLEVDGQRVRLHGIDAPETAQTCQTKKGKPWPCGAATRRRELKDLGDDAGAAVWSRIRGALLDRSAPGRTPCCYEWERK